MTDIQTKQLAYTKKADLAESDNEEPAARFALKPLPPKVQGAK